MTAQRGFDVKGPPVLFRGWPSGITPASVSNPLNRPDRVLQAIIDFEEAVWWDNYQSDVYSDNCPPLISDIDGPRPRRIYLPTNGAVTQDVGNAAPRYDIGRPLSSASNSAQNSDVSVETYSSHAYASVDPTSLASNMYRQPTPTLDSQINPGSSSCRSHGSNTL